MADLLANLPPVPPSLKSIAPYLQRSEELRTQDPIIAYWCAYYAAQIGISLKTRDAASRDLLLALLAALEQTKNEIGPNDAIHNESASSAYVENFALKVFANADNEDRSGHATRSTAKKFLAGANFLEVLKTFPKSDISESNQEKIRYAKWKAADISKAFREGRKPAPGPPGWAEEQEELERLQQEQQIPSAPTLPPSDSEFPPASQPTIAAATLSSYHEVPQDEPSSLSSNIDFSHPPTSSERSPNDPLHPYPGWAETSQTWSTVATSGISEPPNRDVLLDRPDGNLGLTNASSAWGISSSSWSDNATESVRDEENITRARSGSGSSSGTVDLSRAERPFRRAAQVNQEVEGHYSPISSSIQALAEPDNKLKFSPSAIGPQPPQPLSHPYFSSATESHDSVSTVFPPSPSHIHNAFAQQSPSAIGPQPPQPLSHPYFSSATESYDSVSTVFPPSPSHIHNAFAQQSPSVVYSRPRAPPPPPPVPVQEDPGELTPAIISKVQKHCRFAVSALNYEDAEQAKKELRAALALLGG